MFNTVMLTDTHSHLDFPEFAKDLEDVLLRAKQAGAERIIPIGSNPQQTLGTRVCSRHRRLHRSPSPHEPGNICRANNAKCATIFRIELSV
jgi:hypothetical protein